MECDRLLVRVVLEVAVDDRQFLLDAAVDTATKTGAPPNLLALLAGDPAQALQYLVEPARLVQGVPVSLIGTQKLCEIPGEGETYCEPGI